MVNVVGERQQTALRRVLLGAGLAGAWITLSLVAGASSASANDDSPGLLGGIGGAVSGVADVVSDVVDVVDTVTDPVIAIVTPITEPVVTEVVTPVIDEAPVVAEIVESVPDVVPGVIDLVDDTVGTVDTIIGGVTGGALGEAPVGSITGPVLGLVEDITGEVTAPLGPAPVTGITVPNPIIPGGPTSPEGPSNEQPTRPGPADGAPSTVPAPLVATDVAASASSSIAGPPATTVPISPAVPFNGASPSGDTATAHSPQAPNQAPGAPPGTTTLTSGSAAASGGAQAPSSADVTHRAHTNSVGALAGLAADDDVPSSPLFETDSTPD